MAKILKKKPARARVSSKAHLFSDKTKMIRIDLGCGEGKQPGWIGLDLRDAAGVDIIQDLEAFPWKEVPDNVADIVMASHVLEHINPVKGIFLRFMDEVWRITKTGGQFMVSLPYAGSPGYWQDPTHCNGCTEVTWAYFDPLAKDANSGQFYNLYYIYRPKPWKIVSCSYSVYGNMEVIFEKRAIDKSYRVSEDYVKPTKR